MKIMKKFTAILLVVLTVLTLGILAGCGEKDIFVVARDANSGTRGAFEEIIGIKDAEPKPVFDAELDSTGNVITNVSGSTNAIGYISLGSLNDTVKAVTVNGVKATTANVINGTYKISRPFLVVTKKGATLSAFAQDFQKFLASSQAQAIISDEGYVSTVANAPTYAKDASITYTSLTAADKLAFDGSTSVEPLMKELIKKYVELTGAAETLFPYNATGSGDGIKAATNGTAIFGTSSRELKDTEKTSLDELILCKDGIAVIVNKGNSIDNLTLEQIKQIYLKEITKWSELQK